MVYKTIKDLISALNKVVNKQKYIEIMNNVSISLEQIQKYIFWDENFYTRNLINRKENFYELLVLCWNYAQSSPIHNHPGDCFVNLISGQIEEIRFDLDGQKKLVEVDSLVLRQSDKSFIDDPNVLHLLKTKDRSITLHLYFPPIDSCSIFATDGSENVVKLKYYSTEGKKI